MVYKVMDIQKENEDLKNRLKEAEKEARDLLEYIKRPYPIYFSSVEHRINKIIKLTEREQ